MPKQPKWAGRRAVRAARQDRSPREREELPAPSRQRSPLAAGLIGAGIGMAVLAAGGVAVLMMTGVI